MENTSQPGPETENVSALERRVRSLEEQLTKQRSRADALSVRSAADETPQGSTAEGLPVPHNTQLAESSADLETYRDQLRDYERALVERIGDVDDDRRRNAVQLKRAWQSQRDEVDGRLRRQSRITATSLFLLAGLFAVALFLLYRQIGLDRRPVTDSIAEIKQELEQISRIGAQDELIQGKLGGLTEDVALLASSLRQITEGREGMAQEGLIGESAGQEQSDPQLREEIQRLEAEQQRLTQGLESLHTAVASVQSADAAQTGSGDAQVDERALQVAPEIPAEEATAVPVASEPGQNQGATPEPPGSGDETPPATSEKDETAGAVGSVSQTDSGEGQVDEQASEGSTEMPAAEAPAVPVASAPGQNDGAVPETPNAEGEAAPATSEAVETDRPADSISQTDSGEGQVDEQAAEGAPDMPTTEATAAPVASAPGQNQDAVPEAPNTESETVPVTSEKEETDRAMDSKEDTKPSSPAPGDRESIVAGDPAFALQVVGFFDMESVRSFAQRESLPGHAFYLEETFKGRPWYAVVYSLHESYGAASAEISRLPADLVKLNPWIRPVPAGTELFVIRSETGM